MSTTFGVDFPFWEVFANDFARYLTLIPFCSTISLFWGLFFFLTGAGMDIIFKDLEAETIHVCIAWALLNILGFFLYCVFCHLLRLFFFVLFSYHFTDCFLCTSDSGIGEQRASRPLVCGWLGLVASETMGCGVVSV
jgi:hypothetical protein